MRHETDCEVAAIATACHVPYEKARKALSWQQLRGIENPIYGNPINLYRALIKLGFWKRNIKFRDLCNGKAKPGKTIVLIHRPEHPIIQQHWVVWAGLDKNNNHRLWWGNNDKMCAVISSATMSAYFHRGWPNCAFEIYKANAFRIFWEKLKTFF